MLMVKAGETVDHMIDALVAAFGKADLVIDGGNSLYTDTNRRTKALEEKGLSCSSVQEFQAAKKGRATVLPSCPAEALLHGRMSRRSFKRSQLRLPTGTPCCDWVAKTAPAIT